MSADDLAQFVSAVSGEDPLAVEERFCDGFVRLRVAEAERRQAKHDIRCVEDVVIEMLRNARDAHAHIVFVATAKSDSTRTLVFCDDGDGIPPEMHERIFEPRVTSKLESMVMDRWGVHGRGMALYSIKMNATDALVKSSGRGLGSSIAATLDTTSVPERTDQSTMPELDTDDDGTLVVSRGPHNIVRTVVEFALESSGTVDVFLGSPADVVAAMVARGRRMLDDKSLLFTDDISELGVCLRPAAAADATELAAVASSLGLDISERTAHRILAGQIEPCTQPLADLTRRAHRSRDTRRTGGGEVLADGRGLKIAPDDMARFVGALESAFEPIAEGYFVNLSGKPKVRVGRDAISVSFPIDKER